MADLTVENLTKRYGDVIAVDSMDIDIRDGEFVTFVGPSVCGKSTPIEPEDIYLADEEKNVSHSTATFKATTDVIDLMGVKLSCAWI